MNDFTKTNDVDSSHVNVSVIVPVYKVEDYLERCLDSLCAQNLKDVEFLLIDDGSPDRCGDICEEYAIKDSRFRVFHKENGGLSSARNYGIERAIGEYIMFVDSDDWVRSDFCHTAYSLAKNKNSDLVMFGFKEVSNDDENYNDKYIDIDEGYKTWDEAIDLIIGQIGVYAWNKLYKRSLFDGVRYPEGRLFEDQPVTWKLLYKANNIFCSNEIMYFYFMRNTSIIHQNSYKASKDKFEMKMVFYDSVKEKGYSNERLNYYIAYAALSYLIRVKTDPTDKTSLRADKIIKNYKEIPKNMNFFQKIMMFMYINDIPLFDVCCELMGKRIHETMAII